MVVVLVGSFSVTSVSGKGNPASGKVNSNLFLDKQEADLSLKNYGIEWAPDGHISYATFPDGKRRYFIAGNQRAYAIESTTSLSLAETIANNPSIKEVFGPDKNVSYRNGYSTISQVLQTDKSNSYHLFALTQNEQQLVKADGSLDYANFTSTIGLLESIDGGLNWQDLGVVIRGDDYLFPGTKITGAGEPSAIIQNGYVYVYFVDWSAQTKAFHPDQIYLARALVQANGKLGTFEFYTNNGFSTNEADLKSVIPADAIKNGNYSALPSVSYNNYLGKFITTYEVDSGFISAYSNDGINWTDFKTIFSFPQLQSAKKTGDVWYSYPTLLSDSQENSDQNTQKTGNFYFGKGIWPNTPHQPATKTFKIL